MSRMVGVAAGVAVALAGPTAAAGDPSFEFQKAPVDAKAPEWKASVTAGLAWTTGNSDTTALSGTGKVSRKHRRSRFQLEAGGAFARSQIAFAVDANANGVVDGAAEIAEREVTTTKAWATKARYDVFITSQNAAFVSLNAAADEPAGKQFVGGGQVGYSRTLVASDRTTVTAEFGYDLSYEDPVVGDGVAIHSVRAFGGWEAKFNPHSTADASIELLSNVNRLDVATGRVDRFEDTRVNAAAKLTTRVWEELSVGVALLLRYDHAPSARPPLDLPYADGFVPPADSVDTRTEITAIYTFM